VSGTNQRIQRIAAGQSLSNIVPYDVVVAAAKDTQAGLARGNDRQSWRQEQDGVRGSRNKSDCLLRGEVRVVHAGRTVDLSTDRAHDERLRDA
jgi:hypothetical protein